MSRQVGEGWDVPGEVAQGTGFVWFKVRGTEGLRLVVLSESPVWYAGHFASGRMVPCEGRFCPQCAEGIGKQVRYVFCCADVLSRRVGLLEVGQSVGQQIRDWVGRRDGLRGMLVWLGRHTDAKQSRIEVEYVDEPAPEWICDVECLDVRECLKRTWLRQGTKGAG